MKLRVNEQSVDYDGDSKQPLLWVLRDQYGLMICHNVGMCLEDFVELPEVVRRALEVNYLQYREPPPLDDQQPKRYIGGMAATDAPPK
ncbi:MAG TPA: hypothetical protein PK159_05065 [Steroidobacteraceae bacterium]|nr:hypothetical protein [Steroidobacteraceae bacterium]